MKKMTSIGDPRLEGLEPEFSLKSIGLGAGALEAVAESLKEFDLGNTEADVPSSLRHGKKLLPLGRYLRGRLRVLLGKDKGAPKETLEKMVEELREMQRISW